MLPTLWKKNEMFPFMGLRGGIDQLFEDSFEEGLPPAFWGKKAQWPALDVRETDEALIVEAELPGLKPNEFEVKVEEGVLSIMGERKQEKDEKTKNFHRIERQYGRMERKLALPGNVEADKVEASYKDGILTVTLPKKVGTKPKAVAVKVK